jgi:hypothetical protein
MVKAVVVGWRKLRRTAALLPWSSPTTCPSCDVETDYRDIYAYDLRQSRRGYDKDTDRGVLSIIVLRITLLHSLKLFDRPRSPDFEIMLYDRTRT